MNRLTASDLLMLSWPNNPFPLWMRVRCGVWGTVAGEEGQAASAIGPRKVTRPTGMMVLSTKQREGKGHAIHQHVTKNYLGI